MTELIPPILLVGCGRMGGALLAGWHADGLSPSMVIDPAGTPPPAPHRAVTDASALQEDFRPAAVVLAVKPQRADAAMRAVAPWTRDATVLSIMAGRTLDSLRAALPEAGAIVRAMPNTPAAIGRGISVAVAEPGADGPRRALCARLLRAAGSLAWTEDEALLDPVTAVSGSGPAYVFLLTELLERVGVEQGLPPDLARRLARETVAGAGALLAASPDDAAELRRAVTSPGGTTEAALAVLMDEAAWPDLLSRAVAAGVARSRALAS